MSGRLALGKLALLAALAAPAVRLSAQSTDVADLREDVRGLTQKLGDLTLRVEQLERENGDLKAKLSSGQDRDVVTVAELNAAVAQLNAAIKSETDAARTDILQHVAGQMESLAKQTNAALDSMAKAGAAPRPEAPPKAAFGDSFPKEGISYTVQKGDSLGLIAHKTGAKSQDIIDANKLLDPSHIQAGQILFVPGGKLP
jgi:LysM repeat protein/FtsZ-binding cell division protein ZapB